MIVRQAGSDFALIQQHAHALLAGLPVASWGNDRISPMAKTHHALVPATTFHDIGWQPLDANPTWDQDTASPYSVAQLGFGSAYHQTEVLTQFITFVSPPEMYASD